MKWFKHESVANTDAKMRKLRLKYGMKGYGLYWYCVELIASNVDQYNLTFELEHDSEISADDTGISRELVEEMMGFMVDLGLFENRAGTIMCLKLAKRTDDYITKLMKKSEDSEQSPTNSEQKRILSALREESRTEERRREQSRGEETGESSEPAFRRPNCQYKEIVRLYRHHCVPPLRDIQDPDDWAGGRRDAVRRLWLKHPSVEEWESFFTIVSASRFLTGKAKPKQADERSFIAGFDWLVKPANWQKVLEGNYND